MAASAEIGALHVSLSMDSALFESASKKAGAALDGLAFKTAAWIKGMDLAGLAIRSFAASLGAIGAGFKNAIDSAGDFADMAQKFGVPSSQLQALAHAADLSGVSIEELAKGTQKLAVNMTAMAGGETSGKAAETLNALGISATTTAGQLKSIDQMMIDVSDKFAGMEDGAAKTAMAVALFGKAGADLIPMLNLGSAELKKLTDEARNMGLVLDNETNAGLEALGDQWTTIGKTMNGFYTQLAGQLLPTLKFLADEIQNWLNSEGGVVAWAANVSNAIKQVVAWAYEAGAAFNRLTTNLANMGANFADFFSGNWSKIAENNAANAELMKGIEAKLSEDLKAIWAERLAAETATVTARNETVVPQHVSGTTQMTDAQRMLNQAMEDGKRLTEEMQTPMEQLAATQLKIADLMRVGAINATTAGKAMEKAYWTAANASAQTSSKIMGNLSSVFQESKGFAIAQALINTYEAVTAALKGPPGPPWSYAIAASALAAGMAQVANIRSTSKSGGGGGSASSSGLSSAASAATAAQSGPSDGGGAQQRQSVYVTLQGDNYSRDAVRGLIGQINDAVADGAVLRVA